MSERETRRKYVEQLLSGEAARQAKVEAMIEESTRQLEELSRQIVEKYRRVIEIERPQAEKMLERVIQPWLNDFLQAGTYQHLLQLARQNNADINISQPVMYYWPRHELEHFRELDQHPYQTYARFSHLDENATVEKVVNRNRPRDAAWEAGLGLGDLRSPKSLKIWRQPVVGMGIGFGMLAGSLRIALDPQDLSSSFTKIEPEFWIRLGQQIQDGTIWTAIAYSIEKLHREFKPVVADAAYRQRQEALQESYLKGRQWYE